MDIADRVGYQNVTYQRYRQLRPERHTGADADEWLAATSTVGYSQTRISSSATS